MLVLPAGACDAHFHIMDRHFPTVPNPSVPNLDATADNFRAFAGTLGTNRGVVVQPSLYGTDNRLTLRAVAALGSGYRAVLVLDDTLDPTLLPEQDRAGARGLRFNQVQAGATTMAMMPALARQIAGLGWHTQLHARAADLLAHEAMLRALPVPLVLDHCARLDLAMAEDPALPAVLRLLAGGNTWIKLSGPYHVSRDGTPGYEDAVALGRRLLAENPERIIWGSDWPHVTEAQAPASDRLLHFLHACAPNASLLQSIAVDNPARLYGF